MQTLGVLVSLQPVLVLLASSSVYECFSKMVNPSQKSKRHSNNSSTNDCFNNPLLRGDC
jgi:hypothetical protein